MERIASPARITAVRDVHAGERLDEGVAMPNSMMQGTRKKAKSARGRQQSDSMDNGGMKATGARRTRSMTTRTTSRKKR